MTSETQPTSGPLLTDARADDPALPVTIDNPLVAGPLEPLSGPRPGLFSELRRREILGTAGAYLVIAFGLLHALDVIIPALALPEWLMPAFIGAAIVGLPFAITLGWLFDLQPDGVHREEEADHVGFLDPPRRWPRLLLIVGVAIALAIVSLGAWLRLGPS